MGGCVRDLLLDKDAGDWDIATDALPQEVVTIFPRVIPTGIKHGTVTVMSRGQGYEVTTLRGESTYTDGRHPDSVSFTTELADDLARRDFTINAMAIDPLEARLVDPFGGRDDLALRILRAVGDPLARFGEDGLRPLRAARFCATLEFDIEPQTLSAVRPSLSTYRKVSAERVREEWIKCMRAVRPSRGFQIMRETGMLEITAPELLEMVGCEQNRYHAFDVWEHTMVCVDACRTDPVLRVAALLHDVGKPRVRDRNPKTGDYTFHSHEVVGAEIARTILERLRFSNDECDRVSAVILHHLLAYSDDWSDAAVRRFVRRVTPERLDDLFALGHADAIGKGKESEDASAIDKLQARVAEVLRKNDALSVKDLAVNGHDVMRELAIAPGPRIRETLEALLERVLEDPSLNQRETLLSLLRSFGVGN